MDEKGAAAAAETGIVMEAVSAPAVFRADHPFFFVLRDRRSGAILFMGRIVERTGMKLLGPNSRLRKSSSMRLVPIATIFVMVAWLTTASAAAACSCVPYQSAAEQVASADLVFRGRVLKETRSGGWAASTRFRVVEVLKGRAGRTVSIGHQIDDAACGVRFQRGSTVMVIASRFNDFTLRTSLCSSASFSDSEYRRALRGLTSPIRSSSSRGAR